MKSKQLANVLIKILGFSLCVQSVIPVVNGVFITFANTTSNRGGISYFAHNLLANLLYWLVLAAIGILLIAVSRKIAEFLLKGEDV